MGRTPAFLPILGIVLVLTTGCSASPSPAASGFPRDGVGPQSDFCQTARTDALAAKVKIQSANTGSSSTPDSVQYAIQAEAQFLTIISETFQQMTDVAPRDIHPYFVAADNSLTAMTTQLTTWESTISAGLPSPTQVSSSWNKFLGGRFSASLSIVSKYQQVHCGIPAANGTIGTSGVASAH